MIITRPLWRFIRIVIRSVLYLSGGTSHFGVSKRHAKYCCEDDGNNDGLNTLYYYYCRKHLGTTKCYTDGSSTFCYIRAIQHNIVLWRTRPSSNETRRYDMMFWNAFKSLHSRRHTFETRKAIYRPVHSALYYQYVEQLIIIIRWTRYETMWRPYPPTLELFF